MWIQLFSFRVISLFSACLLIGGVAATFATSKFPHTHVSIAELPLLLLQTKNMTQCPSTICLHINSYVVLKHARQWWHTLLMPSHGCRDRRICVCLRPVLQELVPGQAPKLQRNPVSKNK